MLFGMYDASELHAVKMVKGEGISTFVFYLVAYSCDNVCPLCLIVSFHAYRIKLPCLILMVIWLLCSR